MSYFHPVVYTIRRNFYGYGPETPDYRCKKKKKPAQKERANQTKNRNQHKAKIIAF